MPILFLLALMGCLGMLPNGCELPLGAAIAIFGFCSISRAAKTRSELNAAIAEHKALTEALR